jgi:kynurenine formamidase
VTAVGDPVLGKRPAIDLARSLPYFTDAAVHESGVGPFPPMPSWEHGDNPWLPFGVHHHNLTQAGVHQIQNLNMTEMAQKKIYLGAVFILPMRFKGGSGSPVRPVVIGHPND